MSDVRKMKTEKEQETETEQKAEKEQEAETEQETETGTEIEQDKAAGEIGSETDTGTDPALEWEAAEGSAGDSDDGDSDDGEIDERKITCCFTGHRPVKLPWIQREADSRCVYTKHWIAEQLEELYSRGYRRFLCGMALGCDMYFAEEVINLRQKHPEVRLIAAVPCSDQSKGWNKKQKLRYVELMGQCDDAHLVSEVYTKDCMLRRNRYMVENSSFLLACFDGTPGGTMNTVLLADRAGLETRILDISELVRERSKEFPPEITAAGDS